jgi:hypothetical protein
MTAGRELDAAVAERVMGERVVLAYTDHCPECGGQMPDSYAAFMHPLSYGSTRLDNREQRVCVSGRHAITLTPHYSTDIAAAWEVVIKTGVVVGLNHVYPEHGAWAALLDLSCGERWLSNHECATYADTAPLAICLAALRAVNPE